MFGKYTVSALAMSISAALVALCLGVAPAQGYRICTFKGTVIDHGWRNMTLKSGNQCAEVNVGWRTKYIPNRRPCLGENVAVDFILEDGYMKATKVVSLSPLPPSAQCYPPPPPSSATCRTVAEEPAVTTEGCVPPQAACTTKPPAHVTEPAWSPGKKEAVTKPSTKKPAAEGKEEVKKPPTKTAPEGKEEAKEALQTEDKKFKALTGEVVASSPKSLSVRVVDEGEAAEVVNVRVGLKTKFIPFRRPAVGEKVKIEFRQENGDKFGYTVQVVQ
ncbi:MAG: hypothetical protein HY912_13380 [Desulfomonile tiedjei]|uniref:DUF5666 domain-containing protein n=1 Tax=Desulfomonile tiedjei TaxID=2358 RepID=A0A9D6V457_9BACT|nr:hypothetical protein [Desulfomonile tiedjei]